MTASAMAVVATVVGGFAVLFYTYVGYPLLLLVASKCIAKPLRRDGPVVPSVAIVIAVRNGEHDLARRLTELTDLIRDRDDRCEVVVVSDGSTDRTCAIAAEFADRGVRLISLDENQGKAAAISHAVATTVCPIVAFADVRQRWDVEALGAMLENFRDPTVGGVSGELILEESPGVLAGVGMYWRYEKWIRNTESKIGSQIGVTGAIAAVRQNCFRAIPRGTILDDVYWPMQVVLQGKRVVFEPSAKAYDRLPVDAGGEFRRKVRTLAGNFQLIVSCPRLLVPLANPAWLSFVSHKLMRLVCPWAMVAIAAGCAVLVSDPVVGSLATAILVGELVFIGIGTLGLVTGMGSSNKLVSVISSFVLLNFAAAVALWCWATGRTDRLWTRSSYAPMVSGQAGASPAPEPSDDGASRRGTIEGAGR